MVAISSSRNFNHPREFIPLAKIATQIFVADNADTVGSQNSATATCWTVIGSLGVAVNTDFVADTWKTTLSTAAVGGEMAFCIGPTATGTEITTFGFAIDGATEVEVPVAVASGQRAVLSVGVGRADAFGSDWAGQAAVALSAGKTIYTDSGGQPNVWLPPPPFLRMAGAAMLGWRTSVTVRMKHSAGVTDTASHGRQSGIGYRNFLV